MRATSAYFSINGIPEIKLPWDFAEHAGFLLIESWQMYVIL